MEILCSDRALKRAVNYYSAFSFKSKLEASLLPEQQFFCHCSWTAGSETGKTDLILENLKAHFGFLEQIQELYYTCKYLTRKKQKPHKGKTAW